MANNCYDIKLLQYSGTSQAQRQLEALKPSSAKLDDRSTEQLILFAKKYGAYLNYFDANGNVTDDWEDFMSKDVSVTIAAIADWNIKKLTPYIQFINEKTNEAVNDDETKKFFKTIFDLVFSLASNLDAAVSRLPNDITYTDFLSVAINSNLAVPLATLNNFYADFEPALIDKTSTYIDDAMPVTPVKLSQHFDVLALSDAWNVILPDMPQITLGGINVKDDIEHVLTHNLFTGPLQSFINGVINIVSKTPVYFDETISNYPTHQPHYGLFLTFLRLFRFAQDHLNDYTQNHLNFYYKDVLRLNNRNAQPDFVHLTFELQKNVQDYLLAKNTLFKAGKDANSNDLFYTVTNDVVIKKASIQTLQSLYLDKDNTNVLYASPIANSDDGIHPKLSSADKSWFAFGNVKNISPADVGFAIASNLLFLNEGSRSIHLTLECDNLSGLSINDLNGIFQIRLTAKKNWYEDATYTSAINNNSFTLTINLAGDVPPIVPYSQKIHNDVFYTELPIAQLKLVDYTAYQKIKNVKIKSIQLSVSATVKNLSLQNKDGKINAAKPFKPFGDFPVSGSSLIIGSKEIFQKPLTSLTVDMSWQTVDNTLFSAVTVNQIDFDNFSDSIQNINTKNFQLQNAIQPTAKTEMKMMNFDADKISNASNTISNTAQFVEDASISTSISKIDSNSFIKKIYGVPDVPVGAFVLAAGNWKNNAITNVSNILSADVSIPTISKGDIPAADIDFTANEDYTVDSVSGFIKLSMQTNAYSFSAYIDNTQKSLTAINVKSDGKGGFIVDKPTIPAPAPQLIANSINVSYTALTTIDFASTDINAFVNRSDFYFHTEPFGLREMHPFLTDDAITLLPVFNLDDSIADDNGGELWIGIKDAAPEDTLTILFQVADGSANLLKSMTTLSWYFLSANNWLPFAPLGIVDETNNLTRSGIVTVLLPDASISGNTLADANLIWIKLVANHDTDAVCKLIEVKSNAAKAMFVQDISKSIEFIKLLSPNTISKPATPVAAIKKTAQPFTSFDGKLKETNEQFYVRVSERLHHKQRAVTTWDYERLVLDYFPQVHKAKCINHTGFIKKQNSNDTKYSEVLPGHVMLVTVPDLTNNITSDLLRPYTSIGLLEEIQKYLEQYTSPFVRLHVANPQFEEVQFDFDVTFYEGFDINFYSNQLNDDIEKFLTPWAYESNRDIEFGGRIEKSVVLNFVEERPYVDFVTCFKMNHIILREGAVIKEALYNVEEAVASTARSILVSYKNVDTPTPVKHIIQSPANCNC